MKVLPYACLVYVSVQLLPALISPNGWVSLQEEQAVDGYTRKNNHIYCGEVACGAPPMSGVDVTTFQVWPGSKYAKDKSAVYYPLRITCHDYPDCGVCACTKYRLSNVAVQAFTYLGKDYATDHTTVVFRGQALAGADGKSFRVIKGPEFFYFAVDKGHVYKHDQVFVGADPHTFYYDRYHKRTDEQANQYVVADRRHKWLFIPPTTIQVLK
jgi:hypothetical protein